MAEDCIGFIGLGDMGRRPGIAAMSGSTSTRTAR